MSVTIRTIPCGAYQANAYLVYTDGRDDCVVVDPGDDFQGLLNAISRSGRKLSAILLTHGHIDHFGSSYAFKELTGCKIVLGKADKTYATGEEDLSWAKELDVYLETFEPDILINNGDEIKLGNTVVKAVATPGHTPGAMSYFFDVTDGSETFRVGMPGGLGRNSVNKEFLNKYNLPLSLQQDFLNSMDRLLEEKVDIFIGNHVWNNDTHGKYEKLIAGDKHAFVSPKDWAECISNTKKDLEEIMSREQ